MCVKIIKHNYEVLYNPAKPLEDQIKDSKEVIVNYQPFDKSIDKFLEEVQKFSKTSMQELNIKVLHNDNISGFKLKQKLNKAIKDLKINEIIKVMVLSHSDTDTRLSELVSNFVGKTK